MHCSNVISDYFLGISSVKKYNLKFSVLSKLESIATNICFSWRQVLFVWRTNQHLSFQINKWTFDSKNTCFGWSVSTGIHCNQHESWPQPPFFMKDETNNMWQSTKSFCCAKTTKVGFSYYLKDYMALGFDNYVGLY